MTELSDLQRRNLLQAIKEAIQPDGAQAPSWMTTFLPLPTYNEALSKSKLVIRGAKGAGKTTFFSFLREADEKKRAAFGFVQGDEYTERLWLEGFSEREETHPSTNLLRTWGLQALPEEIEWFWQGHLIGQILRRRESEGASCPPALEPFFQAYKEHQTEPQVWVEWLRNHRQGFFGGIDKLHLSFRERGREAWVLYDHLEPLGGEPEGRRFLSPLLEMWLGFSMRYPLWRGKIFLRDDLYRQSLNFPEASKLEGRSIEIQWTKEALYRLLLRSLGKKEEFRDWLETSGEKGYLSHKEADGVGWMPPLSLPEEGEISQKRLLGGMVGAFMATGAKKGYTYRWLPNRLHDGKQKLWPRSFLFFFASAARRALQEGPKAKGNRLLAPSELEGSLEETSRHRVQELQEEYPAVRRIEHLRGMILTIEKDKLLELLKPRPDGIDDGFGDDAEAVFKQFASLGILNLRQDGRIDVPDLYRYGYGMKRLGA